MSIRNLIVLLLILIKFDMFSQNKMNNVRKFNGDIEFIAFLEERNQPYEFTKIDEIQSISSFFFIDVFTKEVVGWNQKKHYLLLYKSIDDFSKYNPNISNIDEITQKYIVSKKRNIYFEEKEIIRTLKKDSRYYYEKIEEKLGIIDVDVNTSFDVLNLKVVEYIKSGKDVNEIFLPVLFFCGNKILDKYGGDWIASPQLSYFWMKYYMPNLLCRGETIYLSMLVSRILYSKKIDDIDFGILLKQVDPFITGKIIILNEDNRARD